MADILVTSPFQPFTLPTQFKAVFNGFIYCGTVDAVDPSVSQVQVYLINESGDKVPVAQPLRTNAGGFLVYNGQPAKFVTDSNHSLLVQDSFNVQVWYAPDISIADPSAALGIVFAQTREALRRSYAEAGYQLVAGSFEVGGTVSTADQILLFEAEGKGYAWGGALPKVVPPGSTPITSGGVAVGAWQPVDDITLRSNLATTSGAGMIVAESGKTLQDYIDQGAVIANVKDIQFAGGAKGNWNETAVTGDDDTAAFQAAINYLASLPDKRHAGARVLYVPQGMYMTKGLIVPASYGFGFNMIGAGRDVTCIYCNPVTPTTTPGLFLETEFTYIDHLSMYGSAKSTIIDTANYVTDLIKVALPDGRADCDLACGEGTLLANAANCVTLYGRGFLFKGAAGLATNFLNIFCSPTQSWSAGSAINDFNTGMRNYMITGCRFDQMNSLVKVTGTGSAIDYIHNLRIVGNDILGIASLVSAPTATLRGFMLANNTALDSGNFDVVSVNNMVAGVISNNIISKRISLESVPTVVNDCLPRIIRAAGVILGATISGNEFGAIRDCVISITGSSGHVRIMDNTFHQAFVLAGGTLVTGFDCSALIIMGNSFTGGTVSIQPWSNSAQVSAGIFKHNIANIKFGNPGNNFSPTVNKGGTPVTPTIATCNWEYDGYYCTARYAISATMSGAGGTINISLPMTPIAEFGALTGSVAGGGIITFLSGAPFAMVTKVLTAGSVNLLLASTGVAMAGTDVAGSLAVEFEVKFRA